MISDISSISLFAREIFCNSSSSTRNCAFLAHSLACVLWVCSVALTVELLDHHAALLFSCSASLTVEFDLRDGCATIFSSCSASLTAEYSVRDRRPGVFLCCSESHTSIFRCFALRVSESHYCSACLCASWTLSHW